MKRRPRGAPEPHVTPEQAVARAKELEALYRPLREAAEAGLEKTKPGRALLENARVLGAELGELYEAIVAGKMPFEKGHRLARQRRNEFLERYESRLFEACAPHVRLQPSVEAVAQILAPELPLQTKWVAETAAPGSMLLTPKVDPDERGTARQGLDDPMGPPVRSCQGPPYTLLDEHSVQAPMGFALTGAFPSGLLMADGWAAGTIWIPVQATNASAWVGQDFKVPAGIYSYKATIDYDFDLRGVAYNPLGLGIVSINVAVLIDRGDGTPPQRNPHSVQLLTVPLFFDQFHHRGSETVTDSFARAGSSTQTEPSNGTVRVWVGIDAHCVSIGWLGLSQFENTVRVKNICVDAAV